MSAHPPIFAALAKRYDSPDTPEDFPLKAYMRGFCYGIVLAEALLPIPRPRFSKGTLS